MPAIVSKKGTTACRAGKDRNRFTKGSCQPYGSMHCQEEDEKQLGIDD